jgi:SHS2 domain-containing protein
MSRPRSGFELVEHTADVAIRGWGPDLSALFRAMAEGLFATVADVGSVRRRTERRLSLDAESPRDLLHDWLDELNALHQIHRELYVEFEVRVEDGHLEAVVRGEPIDFDRHDLAIEVKAVTWHDFDLRTTVAGYESYVLLDI